MILVKIGTIKFLLFVVDISSRTIVPDLGLTPTAKSATDLMETIGRALDS